MTPFGILKLFLPVDYIVDEILVGTNDQLDESEKITLGDFWCWLGLWFIMSLYPGHPYRSFFNTKSRDIFFHPPYLGTTMSCNRFENILKSLRLRCGDPPRL